MSENFNNNRNIIKVDNQLFLKEFELTLEEMRLILLTMAQINADDEEFKIYKIKIKDIEEKTGSLKKNTRVKAMAKRLLSKPIVIDDNLIVNWFSMIKILNGELEVRFDPALKPYLLKLKAKFVKLNLEELLKLKSIYAIRFYIIARTYKNIGQIKLPINELHKKLKTPKSYHRDFRNFRLKVLEIAQKEINEKTDIKIDFEFITKGRKVTDIILKIKETKLLENKKQPHKAVDNFNKFRQNLIKSNVIITLKDKHYEIKDGYLWQDDKLLNKEEAFEAWQELYKNKDQIKIIENRQQFEAEREENRKEQLKQELLRAYFGKKYELYAKNALGSDELLYYEILKIEDITFKKDGTIDLITFIGRGEDGRNYRLKATLNQLKQYTR
jgi:plasmid replication initiation protein